MGLKGLGASSSRFTGESPQSCVDFEYDVGQVAAQVVGLFVFAFGEHGGRNVATQFMGNRHNGGGLLRGQTIDFPAEAWPALF